MSTLRAPPLLHRYFAAHALWTDTSGGLSYRRELANCLAGRSEPSAMDALAHASTDRDPELRIAACHGLAHAVARAHRNREAVEAAVAAIDDLLEAGSIVFDMSGSSRLESSSASLSLVAGRGIRHGCCSGCHYTLVPRSRSIL